MTRSGPTLNVSAIDGIAEIRLPETPTSGYRWSIVRAPEGVQTTASRFEGTSVRDQRVGGGGERVIMIAVPTPGRHELQLELRQEWNPSQPAEVRTIIIDAS